MRTQLREKPSFWTASNADKFHLYQQAIQGSELIEFLERRCYSITGKHPRLFREDFCGTAFNCCEFVKIDRANRAIGVDLDESALRWCQGNNFIRLRESEWSRITLIKGNVLSVKTNKVDLIAALNFSYCIFKTRPLLLSYLKNARRNLLQGGVFMMDAHGGPLILEGSTYTKKTRNFTYICEGSFADPITNGVSLKIHYQFPDGTRMRNAFLYDFRLWSLPELTELMEEAGFRNVHILWEGTDRKKGIANGIFRKTQSARECYPMWIAYVVGQA